MDFRTNRSPKPGRRAGLRGRHWLVLLSLGVCLATSNSMAESGKNRDREMLRRVQQQMQQIQSQVSSLEQEKARLGQDLEKADKEAKAAKSRVYRLNRELKSEQAKSDGLAKELEQTKQELGSSQERLAQTSKLLEVRTRDLQQTSQNLALTQAEKQRLEGVKAWQETEIGLCEGKNKQLYGIGRELMVRFQNKSCAEITAENNPFTGPRRVEVENLMEQYRDQLDDQKIIKPPGG